jgi:hypothetical protein
MSKRDHKASESDWRSPESRNMVGRTYPAKKSVKVTTVLKWIALAVAVIVMAKMVGGQ